jgi:hypothetical protein
MQQVSAAVEYSGKNKECRYKFDVDEAVLRLRFPKFSTHIRVTFGPVAECVMEAILDHGRATWDQIKAACSEINEDKLKDAGDILLEGKYLTKVVSSLPEEEGPSSSAQHAAPSRPSPFPSKPGGKRGAASSPAQQRPSKVRRLEDDESESTWNAYNPGDDYSDAVDGVASTGALWRVNSEAFSWDFRAVAVGHLAQDISGNECGSLMPTLLKAVRTSALAHRVQSVSVDTVLELASDDPKQANVDLSWESVSEKLMTLAQDSLVKRVNDFAAGTTVFEPDLRKLHRAVRQDIIERVVEAKMGWQARRVLKLLLHHQLLESKTVWDLAMLPKKDANEVSHLPSQIHGCKDSTQMLTCEGQVIIFKLRSEHVKVEQSLAFKCADA